VAIDTDRDWEKWGARDPYFGVLTNPDYRRENLDDAKKEEFFVSGRTHVDHVLRACRERIDATIQPRRVLDFGCGVGRVTFAFAATSETVIGLDVSDSMLREAERNRQERHIENVTFLKSDDTLSQAKGTFDFIHSFIVFQHLEVHRGRTIFAQLIDRLAPGGIFAAHFTYAKAQHADSFGKSPAAALLPPAGTPESPDQDPVMLMNPYDVNELLFIMQSADITDFFTEFTDHGGELGILLYFKKPPQLPTR